MKEDNNSYNEISQSISKAVEEVINKSIEESLNKPIFEFVATYDAGRFTRYIGG